MMGGDYFHHRGVTLIGHIGKNRGRDAKNPETTDCQESWKPSVKIDVADRKYICMVQNTKNDM